MSKYFGTATVLDLRVVQRAKCPAFRLFEERDAIRRTHAQFFFENPEKALETKANGQGEN